MSVATSARSPAINEHFAEGHDGRYLPLRRPRSYTTPRDTNNNVQVLRLLLCVLSNR